MGIVYLRSYKQGEDPDGYNVPHKYRYAKLNNSDNLILNSYVNIWRTKRDKILNELIQQIENKGYGLNDHFAFACAPSTTTIFISDIHSKLIEKYPNATDLTFCFEKSPSFTAAHQSGQMKDEELKNHIYLKESCREVLDNLTVNHFILVDDVYATGNTLRALEIAIESRFIEAKITKFAILKTS